MRREEVRKPRYARSFRSRMDIKEREMKKRLLNVTELSEYLSMPVATIYTYVSMQKIPAHCIRRIGRSLKFELAEVDQWVNENAKSPDQV